MTLKTKFLTSFAVSLVVTSVWAWLFGHLMDQEFAVDALGSPITK
jgi:hypothetical protein